MNGKDLIIEEKEADIVRWMFQAYLAGRSSAWIAEEMEKRKIQTAWGRGIWNEQVIRKILSNEKYIGDSLCRKTYTTDTFPSVRKVNQGEADRYYVENTHPAIILKNTYDRVQVLMAGKGKRQGLKRQRSPLQGKIVCGACGTLFLCKRVLLLPSFSVWFSFSVAGTPVIARRFYIIGVQQKIL